MSPVDLIEPPLRTHVMIAQNYAGMWRRNGFSLLNQVSLFYSSEQLFHLTFCGINYNLNSTLYFYFNDLFSIKL